MLSNDLRSLNILSKTRLSIPHLRGGGGGGGQFFRCILQGEETFLTLALQENYISPTHRKNDTSLSNVYVAGPDPDPNPRGGGQLPNPKSAILC